MREGEELGPGRGVIPEVTEQRRGHRAGPGGPGDAVTVFSDFRQTGALMLPYKVETTLNGEPLQSASYEEIVVNPAVDDAMFAKPAGS